MEKFEIEVKWASYFIIVNAIVMNIIALFGVVFFSLSFEDRYNTKFMSNFIVVSFIIQLFYFVRKAIKDNKEHQTIRFLAKMSIFFRVLSLYIFMSYLLNQVSDCSPWKNYFNFPIRKNNLSEFLIEDDEVKENTSNWLNDLVVTINKRFVK